ncbi:hypothetical protein Ocin01_05500 [Orchesella cincta]|uniref:Uncharacterized protein n=1 Tax=Orchesella cincta TaxID=48709 RepID=A0A1D2N7C9_ORCCI|nr:hypothetical protein Ocin01_05500 [Orchesella cincta]
MKSLIAFIAFISALSVTSSVPVEDFAGTNKVHLFVLLVPDATVQELKKARQEEAAGLEITETGAYVGQIISGVLGGDVRPIFAGSASFIGEEDVQQGVSTILANVAPSVNMILKQWVSRVQTALGFTSTPRPGTLAANGTNPSNGAIAGQPLGGTQQQAQQSQQQQPVSPGTVQFNSNQDHSYEHTTVEPLPLLKLKGTDEDNEDDGDRIKVAK